MSEAISARGLTKKYGEKTIINHLNLQAKSGAGFAPLFA